MTTLRTAARQALEALEDFGMKHYENTGEALHRDVYESLKAALAEPVLNPAPGYCKHCKQYTIEEPLPAEPVQEPVWIQPDHLQKARQAPFLCRVEPTRRFADFVPLYTAPPQRKPLTETSAERTLKRLGYTDCGGEFWKPPLGAPAEPVHGIGGNDE